MFRAEIGIYTAQQPARFLLSANEREGRQNPLAFHSANVARSRKVNVVVCLSIKYGRQVEFTSR